MRGHNALQSAPCAIHTERLLHFAPAFGVRTRPRVAFARASFSCHDQVVLGSLETSSVPKRIKVEPIVRRQACVVLEPRDVAFRPRLDFLGATLAIQCDLVGKMFEVNVVAVSSAVEAEE